jgi:sugar lactone lactonase YvrE
MKGTHRTIAGAIAMLAACTGVRADRQQGDPPPAFQLGDSVTMPVRAVTGSHESEVAFRIAEKDLIPESVAHDVKTGAFFVGSLRKAKIVRVDRDGRASDFITSRQDGLWAVVGIKIHPVQRVLWVCSANSRELEGSTGNEVGPTGVFLFDLDTGKLIEKWLLEAPSFFNDVVLTRGNDAYVTNMKKDPEIYRIRERERELELFMKTDGLSWANGITISPDEKTLFVAGTEGVQAIEIATRKARLLDAPDDEPMGNIDGLYYYRGGLIGVRGSNINRYRLDDAMNRIIMTEVLEQKHPLMNVPTTGVLAGDEFYYVANSQLDAVNPDGTLKTDELTDTVILKLKLR